MSLCEMSQVVVILNKRILTSLLYIEHLAMVTLHSWTVHVYYTRRSTSRHKLGCKEQEANRTSNYLIRIFKEIKKYFLNRKLHADVSLFKNWLIWNSLQSHSVRRRCYFLQTTSCITWQTSSQRGTVMIHGYKANLFFGMRLRHHMTMKFLIKILLNLWIHPTVILHRPPTTIPDYKGTTMGTKEESSLNLQYMM